MDDITELFAELREASRIQMNEHNAHDTLLRIIKAVDALDRAICAGGIIPENIFDGLNEDARRVILACYLTFMVNSATAKFKALPE